jgi:NADH:ubiquinone oxidoreductase subunit E
MQKTIGLPSTSETELKQFIRNITVNSTRKDLIQVLQRVQEKYGYLEKESLRQVATNLGVSFSEVYGVATFYHQFRLQPPGMYVIQVCMGTGCHAKGNADNFENLKLLLDLKPGQHLSKDKVFSLEAARCFGCCSLAPVIAVTDSTGSNRRIFGYVDQKGLKKILAEYQQKAKEQRELKTECKMVVCQKK